MNDKPKLNVLPINDIQPHRHDEHCYCNPTVKEHCGSLIITHNSFDGREFKEVKAESEVK